MSKKKTNKPARSGAVTRARIRVNVPGNEMQTVFDVQLGLELQARIGHTFRSVGEENARRDRHWNPRGIESRTALEWSARLSWYANKALNASHIVGLLDRKTGKARDPEARAAAVKLLGSEIGATYLLLDLLAQREGIDLRQAVIDEFNRVSVQDGLPERL